MNPAKAGDTVRVHYTGKLEDGTVFDTSSSREPLEFKIGEGQIIPGFENAIIGMSPGDSKTETIQAADAYGEHRDDMILKVERKQISPDISPEVGQIFEVRQDSGVNLLVTIVGLSDDHLTLDANHPLAGKDLTFDINLVAIM